MEAPSSPLPGPSAVDAGEGAFRSAAAPPVLAVVVAHDPGPWFADCLASLGAQDYPSLRTVVLDAASAVPVDDVVEASLPGATVLRLDEDLGFGPSIDAVLDDLGDEQLLLLCHDDVRLEPDAVRLLVEEAFRSNAGILGPKQVTWDDARRLLHVGASVDKTGVQAPFAEVGELDQEQHDSVRDVAMVAGGVQLVRADLLRALGGFDPAMAFYGEDLDLCWRAAVAGARVLIVPRAVVAHRADLSGRRGVDEGRRLLARHRLRTTLVAYRPFHRLRVLPQALLLAALEAVTALLLGHLRHARDVVGAWTWNLARLGEVRGRRRALNALRRVPDSEIRQMQVRGSARINAYVRGQIGSASRRAAPGVDDVATSRASVRIVAVAWSIAALVLVVGSRHLLTRGVPTVGDLGALPSPGDLLAHLTAVYRDGGVGTDAVPATGLLLLLAPLAVLPGGLAHTALVVGLLPLGALGAWRLARPTGSRRTAAALLLLYLVVPLGYDALAIGSWSGLLLYATAPWLVARLGHAARLEPFGAARRPVVRDVVSTGALVAVVLAFVPGAVVVVGIVVLGLAVGGLLSLAPRGILRLLGVTVGAAVVVALLHAAWLPTLVEAGWRTTVGTRALPEGAHDLASLVRLDVGPDGASMLGWLLLVPAALPLLIGRGWRFTWAVRGWSLALASWGVAWCAVEGWLPIAVPSVHVLLAPAGVGLALAGALGVSVVEEDLPDYHLGWRQMAAVLAMASLVVSLLPLLGDALGGRWNVPRGDFDTILGFADDAAHPEDGPSRVLVLGAPEVVPGAALPVVDGTVAVVRDEATSTVLDAWPARPTAAEDDLLGALRRAVDGTGGGRLGQALATYGIRTVIAPQQLAPAPYATRTAPTDPEVLAALAQQLDLARIDVNAGVVVYRNEAFVPWVGLVPGGTTVDPVAGAAPGLPPGVRPVLRGRADYPDRRGEVGEGDAVRVASASNRWRLSVDGREGDVRSVADGVLVLDVPATGSAVLRHEPAPDLRAGLAAEAVLWLVLVLVLVRWRSRDEAVGWEGGAP